MGGGGGKGPARARVCCTGKMKILVAMLTSQGVS